VGVERIELSTNGLRVGYGRGTGAEGAGIVEENVGARAAPQRTDENVIAET
jgi:hypothetical protein